MPPEAETVIVVLPPLQAIVPCVDEATKLTGGGGFGVTLELYSYKPISGFPEIGVPP